MGDGRDELMLLEHVREGTSLRDLAARSGVSHETVRKRLRAATHDHIRDIVVNLWQAQRDGQMLLLAIPAGFDAEQNLAIDYLRWVLGQLAELWGIRADVHYRPTPDGAIAFGLTDPAMPGGQP